MMKSEVRIQLAIADCRDFSERGLGAGLRLLSSTEQAAHASRVGSRGKLAGRRFIVSRLLVRWLVMQRFGPVNAAAIELIHDACGRPQLHSSFGDGLCAASQAVSLSDTHHFVAVLIGDVAQLGVDIELARRFDARAEVARSLAKRFYGPDEQRFLRERQKPKYAYARAFIALWVQKEALLKAMGSGLSRLKDAEVLPTPADFHTYQTRVSLGPSRQDTLAIGLCLPKSARPFRLEGYRLTLARQFVA